ncbi:ras association domain-containing protein 7-like isoform X1 [Gambusia affinis]|uniref:ras association domain-containing protein 7-like isoform X1 n=1 Tax=Gambusia affinis TaxID=33528 RepID=UPI001CDB5411|nr:ras association domain-containing protein 7-like isoform X1 [Gambusia affinis]XP_043960708.1 ras association domain-containing protein 7-like isoform X1 [Gambusia affinis]XP_043960717.1 ras association domain-containing protein 7-like isoform X1 [Gambusia affinis]XP_043960725.1 ras association domain-containing protein 7-like isoform X1 [Gambusia affinis]XP_043960735.1 ras association domain-containing protein 7-like isoform X1 [Gambusia affinis]
MELKVWVDGVIRVVCGLSFNTSCQEVVISLAQAIGQTGRYVLIRKFRGLERPLVADDCPMQLLAQMGQLAAEVQFVLRKTGPSLSEGPHTPSKESQRPLLVPSEPEPQHKGPQKALSFNLGPSTFPRRNRPSRNWSPSLEESAEEKHPSDPEKEEMLRQILLQQKMLQDLEAQIEALEKDTELFEQNVINSAVPDPIPDLTGDLQELEYRLKQYEVELMYGEDWEEELKVELEREQDMQRRLQQIHSSIDDQSYEMKVLQSRSDHLEQDLQDRAQTSAEEEGARLTDEALRSLTQELHKRLQRGEDLDAALAETQWKLQTVEETVKDRLEQIDGLNKELRQCDLQQFIQQAGGNPYADQGGPLPVSEVHRSKTRVRK